MQKLSVVAISVLLFMTPLSLIAAETSGEPKDFRGLQWGITPEDAKAIIESQWQKRREAGEIILDTEIHDRPDGPRARRLSFRDKIGHVMCNFALHFLDEKFSYVTIIFPPKDFDTIDAAFKARYGKPKVERAVPMENPFGARFNDEQRMWEWETIEIFLTKYADARTSGARLGMKSWSRFKSELEKQKKAKAAKDL